MNLVTSNFVVSNPSIDFLLSKTQTIVDMKDLSIAPGLHSLSRYTHTIISEAAINTNETQYGIIVAEGQAEEFFSNVQLMLGLNSSFKANHGRLSGCYSVPDDDYERFVQSRVTGKAVASSSSESEQQLQKLFTEATKARSADVHITMHRDRCDVEFRVQDDLWHYSNAYSRREMDRLLRALFNLDSSTGATQSTFSLSDSLDFQSAVQDTMLENKINIRYHHSPCGGDVVDVTMRLSPIPNNVRTPKFVELELSGYLPDQAKLITQGALNKTGLLLIVGVTGSGKTTQLKNLAIFKFESRNRQIKLISIEDPMEILLPFLRSIDVTRTRPLEIKATNGKATIQEKLQQSISDVGRSDTDGVLLGEIRTESAAQAVVGLCDTGQHIMSTIHASSALSAIEKLINLGCPPQVVLKPDFYAALVYQRLVQKLCNECSLTVEEAYQGKVIDQWGKLMITDELYKLINTKLSKYKDSLRVRYPNAEHAKSSSTDHKCPACASSQTVVTTPANSEIIIGSLGISGLEVAAEVAKPTGKLLELFSVNRNKAYQYYETMYRLDGKNSCDGLTATEHFFSKVLKGQVCVSYFDSAENLSVFVDRCETISDSINFQLRKQNLSVNGGTGFDLIEYLNEPDLLSEWQREYKQQRIRQEEAR